MPKIARGLGSIPPKPIYVLLSLGRESGMVSLGVGEPDFDAPKEAVEAAKESLDKKATHYTPDPGTLELREAILEKTRRDNNFAFDIESEIMVTAGSSAAVFGAAMVTVETGDEVILPAPAYLAYEPIVKLAGGTPVFVSAREDTAFVPTEEAIKEAISPKTSALIVCSPNNPTGAVWDKSTLKAAADLANDHDFYVISDELYERIVFDGNKAHSIASLDNVHERIITINGVSKSHAMTGFRVGWLIGPRIIVEAFRKIHQYTAICAPAPSQAAATAALRYADYHVKHMVSEYDRRRKLLLNRINNDIPMISSIPPIGAFYMFVNVEELVSNHFDDMISYLHSAESKWIVDRFPETAMEWIRAADSGSKIVMLYLTARAKTLTAPGIAFGPIGENFLRVSFAQKYDRIEKALDMIEDSIKALL